MTNAATWPPEIGIEPYYADKAVVIYHADCRDVVPKVKADIAVTSPPYNTLPTEHAPSGLHAERMSGVNKWIKKSSEGYADSKPEKEYQDWLRGIVDSLIVSCSGLVWINHKIRYRDGEAVHPIRFLPYKIYAEIIWDRGGSMALNCKRYAPSHEIIIGFGTPHYWDDSENMTMSVWRIAPERSENHPCPFPEIIPRRLITSSCPTGGVVLDPFAGSGTTGRAAKDLGRRCIMIEKEEKYCKIAAERMRQRVFEW